MWDNGLHVWVREPTSESKLPWALGVCCTEARGGEVEVTHVHEEACGGRWDQYSGSSRKVQINVWVEVVMGPSDGDQMGRRERADAVHVAGVLFRRLLESLSERQEHGKDWVDILSDSIRAAEDPR